MKKQTRIGLLLLFFVALCLLLTPTKADAAIVDSGSCGDNLTWTLDDQGLLTISGTGAMTEWLSPDSWWGGEYSPWNYNYDIKQVVIEEGVTSIGDYSFYICEKMMSIQIPDSVTSIGRYAFFAQLFLK